MTYDGKRHGGDPALLAVLAVLSSTLLVICVFWMCGHTPGPSSVGPADSTEDSSRSHAAGSSPAEGSREVVVAAGQVDAAGPDWACVGVLTVGSSGCSRGGTVELTTDDGDSSYSKRWLDGHPIELAGLPCFRDVGVRVWGSGCQERWGLYLVDGLRTEWTINLVEEILTEVQVIADDDETPIEGATVGVVRVGRTFETNEAGWTIPIDIRDRFLPTVRADGYLPQEVTAGLMAEVPIEVVVRLQRAGEARVKCSMQGAPCPGSASVFVPGRPGAAGHHCKPSGVLGEWLCQVGRADEVFVSLDGNRSERAQIAIDELVEIEMPPPLSELCVEAVSGEECKLHWLEDGVQVPVRRRSSPVGAERSTGSSMLPVGAEVSATLLCANGAWSGMVRAQEPGHGACSAVALSALGSICVDGADGCVARPRVYGLVAPVHFAGCSPALSPGWWELTCSSRPASEVEVSPGETVEL